MSMIIDLVDDSDEETNHLIELDESPTAEEEDCVPLSQFSVHSESSSQSNLSQVSQYSQSSSQSSAAAYASSQYATATATAIADPIRSTIRKATAGKNPSQKPVSKQSLSKQERDSRRQATGKYRMEEIAIIFTEDLTHHPLFPVTSQHFIVDNSFFGIYSMESTVKNLIRWSFRPKALGGQANLNESNVVVLPFAVLVFPSDEFIRLISLSTDIYSFDELATNISMKLEEASKLDHYPPECRISLLLINLDQELLAFRKKHQAFKFDLDDVIAFLLHEYQVEVIRVKSYQEISEYLFTVTRFLSGFAYKKKSTEFDLAPRVSKTKAVAEMNESDKEILKLQETWIGMLQMIPLVSREKAKYFVRQENFTCPQNVLKAFENEKLSEDERKLLAANDFSRSQRSEKISRELYNLFMQLDPTASIDA